MSSTMTFEQWVIKTYGKSVYLIALEIAQGIVIQSDADPKAAWLFADKFIEEMRRRHEGRTPA